MRSEATIRAGSTGIPKAVKAVTREQVNAAIKAHINPNAMVLVEAGSVPPAAK